VGVPKEPNVIEKTYRLHDIVCTMRYRKIRIIRKQKCNLLPNEKLGAVGLVPAGVGFDPKLKLSVGACPPPDLKDETQNI